MSTPTTYLEVLEATSPAHRQPSERQQNWAPVVLGGLACLAAVMCVVLNIVALAGHIGAAPVVISLIALGLLGVGAVATTFSAKP